MDMPDDNTRAESSIFNCEEPIGRRGSAPCKGLCNISFLRKTDLERHHRLTHSEDRTPTRPHRKHFCNWGDATNLCGRGFGRPADLAKHRRVHTGERPYICTNEDPHCRKAFAQVRATTILTGVSHPTRPSHSLGLNPLHLTSPRTKWITRSYVHHGACLLS